MAAGRGETDAQEAPSEVCPRYNKPRPSPELPNGGNDKKFYPHYFLEPDKLAPDKYVKREPFLPELGHEKFNNGLLTGKITCSLKTLTPLIVPDSMYEYEFCSDAETESVKKLCGLLMRDIGNEISLTAAPDSVDWLNELLKKPELYDILKKSDCNLPEDILELDAKTQGYRTRDFNMSGENGVYVRMLNCYMLEKFHKNEVNEVSRHKSYPFFRIHDHIQIPGSEIKGPVSSVYETITNSCLRVMDEQVRLSWRMKAKNLSKKLKRGRVVDGGKAVEIYEKSARLPFYDSDTAFNLLSEEQREGKASVKLWVELEVSITAPCELKGWRKLKGDFTKIGTDEYRIKFSIKNKKYDISRKISGREADIFGGLLPEKEVDFWFKKRIFVMASLEEPPDLVGWEEREGYLKVTGPSKVEVGPFEPDDGLQFTVRNGIPEDWKSIRTNGVKKEGNKTIKVFRCTQGKNLYSMSKWCETFFYNPLPDTKEIPPDVCEQYNRLIEKYKVNPQAPPPVFRSLSVTRDDECLREGDLVYVVLNDKDPKVVKEIFPVYISRTMDEAVLGDKMENMGQGDLRPCDCEINGEASVPKELCPACRLFGTTSYKGRVRFGFASLVDEQKKVISGGNGALQTLPLLEKPRPTWSMPDKNFKVPGRKFYVHHNVIDNQEEKKEHNKSVERFSTGANEFTFDIFFENLEKWELGLLLYSLELEPENNLAHKMGMAKAHGFGSVQITINKISFRVNPIMYKMVNGSRCKNRLIDMGYAQLREWDGTGKEWYDIPRIQRLRKLLKYENETTRKVEYPELEGKDGFPGYTELGDEKNWLYKDRVACLTTPWEAWYPYKKAPKENRRAPNPTREGKKHTSNPLSRGEYKSPLQGGNSGMGKGRGNYDARSRRTEDKSNIPLEKKCAGTVKWYNEKKGFGFIAQDGGEDVFVHKNAIAAGVTLKEGLRVEFDIVKGEKGLNACNVKTLQFPRP